jgi:hypothetical protein
MANGPRHWVGKEARIISQEDGLGQEAYNLIIRDRDGVHHMRWSRKNLSVIGWPGFRELWGFAWGKP